MPSFRFDDAGNVAPPDAEELAKADADSAILVYMTGTVEDGRPYYAYLAVKPSRYCEFMDLNEAKAQITPEEYGTILASGFESSAPPETIVMMRNTYGFDEQYLEKLRQGIVKDYVVFMKNKEDQWIGDIVAMLKKKQTAAL